MADATCRDGRPFAGWRAAPIALATALLTLVGACAPMQDEGAPPEPAPQDTPAEPPSESDAPARPDPATIVREAIAAPEEFELKPPPRGDLPRHRVGLLLPLSGAHADLGEAALRAAQLALYDIADDDFALIVRDTKGTPDGAARAAEEAIAAGANLLLGPVFSSSVDAVAPVAQGGRVPVVAFSNNRAVARPEVFVTGLLPGEQVDRIVGYAARQGHQSFAVLAPANSYGDLVVGALEEAVRKHDVQLVRTRTFPPDVTPNEIAGAVKALAAYQRRKQALEQRRAELRSQGTAAARRQLRELKGQDALGKAPFDAILLPIGGQKLRQLAPTLPYYDIDPDEVRFLGTELWNGESTGSEPTLRGGWFPTPPDDRWAGFQEDYREVYGNTPPRLAALAYDATALVALLARRASRNDTPPTRVFTAEALTRRSGFAGVNGLFRLNRDGLVERRYAVVEVQPDGVKVIDPAPSSFAEPKPATN